MPVAEGLEEVVRVPPDDEEAGGAEDVGGAEADEVGAALDSAGAADD